MGIAVYIATTAGPVRIERITEEHVPQSNIFVGRGYVPLLPISKYYDSFVSVGGPVARAFGPFNASSFRLDISDPIDTGNSWELGVFVAHGLAKAAQLAGTGEPVDGIILVTGRVDSDFNVGAVGHIEKKALAASECFEKKAGNKNPVTFFIPKGDSAKKINSAGEFRVISVETAPEIFRELGVNHIFPGVTVNHSPERTVGKGLFYLLLIGILGALLAFFIWTETKIFQNAWFKWVVGHQSQTMPLIQERETVLDKDKLTVPKIIVREPVKPIRHPTKTSEALVKIKVFERRPPEGGTCPGVHFAQYEAVETNIEKPDTSNSFNNSVGKNLCGLRFHVALSEMLKQGIVRFNFKQGRFLKALNSSVPENSLLTLDREKSWIVDLPLKLRKPILYSVEVHDGEKWGTGSPPLLTLTHQVSP